MEGGVCCEETGGAGMFKFIRMVLTVGFFSVFLVSAAFAQTAEQMRDPNFVGPIPYMGPRIEINVAARQLNVYNEDGVNSNWVMSYPIAVGSPAHPTPLGERKMAEIIWNPIWYPPDSDWAKDAVITPPGPGNPLGPVKMDLGAAILIHGTNKPNSIGKAASHGCMRMRSEDAKALAWYLQQQVTELGTPEEMSKYQKFNRRSFFVKIAQPIPVNIVYKPFEIRDQQLFVYQDVYGYYKNKEKFLANLTEVMQANGYDLSQYNLDYVQTQRSLAKAKDLVLSFHDFALPGLVGSEQAKNELHAKPNGMVQ